MTNCKEQIQQTNIKKSIFDKLFNIFSFTKVETKKMYITFCFDITDKNEEPLIKEKIKNLLANLYWVKPLSNYFIIDIDDYENGLELRKEIISLGRQYKGKFRFLVSPIYNIRGFGGIIPKDLWDSIKDITIPSEPD